MNADDRRSPLFSIVIPVYNGEEYVAEAIDSVLSQTIGLGALEVVVVDDGSEDGTGSIVDAYASQHSEVVVIHQENAGVASALNTGVDAARGDYVGFLGSDDLLSDNALELVGRFFAEHGDECDLVAIPIFMFGARRGPHWNNGSRFAQTRVIDVAQEWNTPQAAGGGTFISTGVFREGLRFDPRLFISEDQTLNTQVILRKMAYGVVADARYFNRRHPVGGSLVSSSHFRREFYTDIPRFAYQRTLDIGRELHGEAPRYAQAVVAYDLSWRFRADLSAMEPDLEPEYRCTLRDLLRQIDIDVIMAQHAPIEVRLSMLAVREGMPLRELVERRGETYYVGDVPVYSVAARPRSTRHRPARCDIEFFEVHGDQIEIDGVFRLPHVDDWEFFFAAGDRHYPIERVDDPRPVRLSYGNEVTAAFAFHSRVELRDGERLVPYVRVGKTDTDEFTTPVQARMNRFTRFSGRADAFYHRRDGRTVFRRQGKYSIERREVSIAGVLRAEAGFFRRAARAGARPKVLVMRAGALARRAFRRRDIWIMADHKSEAGDNAEAMFRHLCAHPRAGVVPYFVLRKDADEYAELKRLGKVVAPGSRAHLRAYVDAAVVMNSAGDNYMLDPLGRKRTYLNDLLRHRSVFLQHGVTKDDQSAWLNRRAKGFDIFVTSSSSERESILKGNYGYRPDQVVLTGLPRFDRLSNSPDRLLVLAPTWRTALAGVLDPETGRVGPSPLFAHSDYFAFWQRVVLDPRLNDAMSEGGFTGMLALHPSHSAEASTFRPSAQIEISPYPHDYRDLFNRGSVLVTDYSSVAFDFAYLRKPVIYAQGDRNDFYGGHLYTEGYFTYERDGFGPVVDTANELVDALLALMATSCDMDPRYLERVDRFFAFSGGGNSERVCQTIERRLAGGRE